MNSFPHSTIRIVSLLAAFFLSACVSEDESYGKFWSSRENPNPPKNLQVPSNAPSITNVFYESASNHKSKEHLGIDITATLGTPVIAAANGRVLKVFTEPFYGNNIVLEHGTDEDGTPIFTHYKHLDSQLVSVGDTIARGQQIGTLGRTGILSGSFLHLHFEVQKEGRLGQIVQMNPNDLWVNGPDQVT